MSPIYLDPRDVPQHLKSGYSGRKFQACVTETLTIRADAGLWSGGSRDVYSVIRLADGAAIEAVAHGLAPWDAARGDVPVTLRPGFAVVCRSTFCGRDHGLTFYVHPSDAAALLPAPAADLTAHETIVLHATCSFKASYNGRDRYDMARQEHRYTSRAAVAFPTREEWDAAKASLIARGYLNKAGAVTVAGRNARPR